MTKIDELRNWVAKELKEVRTEEVANKLLTGAYRLNWQPILYGRYIQLRRVAKKLKELR